MVDSKKKKSKLSPKKPLKKGRSQSEAVRSVTAEIVHEEDSKETPESWLSSTERDNTQGDNAPLSRYDSLDASEEDIESEPLDDSSELIPKPKSLALSSSSKALATTDPMALYIASIQKYPLLTRDEEKKLATHYYETKDPEAAQALVTANLRFVVKVAAEYSRFGAKLIDLVQEGNIGLLHAVREFNPYKGVRLITYAVWWIRGYIQEYLMRQYSMVRIGTTQNQRKLFYRLKREKEALDALEGSPEKIDYDQLAETLGVPKDEIIEMQKRLSSRDISLDRPLDDETKSTLGDLQKAEVARPLDEELALREQLHLLKEKIETLRPTLSERELIILDERLLADDPLTLQEIGEKYQITREAVRQMEVRVMNKIKKLFLSDSPDESD